MLRGFQVFVSGVVLAGLSWLGQAWRAAQEPAKEPAKPVSTLEGEAAIVILLIKPDKTADFEAVVAKYQEAFGKSDNPKRKEQLAGMKFFKSPTAVRATRCTFSTLTR